MTTTYSLTEGNDALNRVLLMMRYDLSKTLNENVISEQMPEPGDFKDNPSYGGKNVDISKIPSTGYYTIKATTMSEALSKLREFFFTPKGAATQVVLSIVGAEIGLPLVFELLDTAIIVNDAYIMLRDWNSNGPKMSTEVGPTGSVQTKGLWEWFEFHWNSNIGFQNLIVDISCVLIGMTVMGLGKTILKSAKGMFKFLIDTLGNNFLKKMINPLENLKPNTKELPKEVGGWVDKKFSEINKVIDLWKTPEKALKTIVKPLNLVFAGASIPATYVVFHWLEKMSPKIMKFIDTHFNSNEVSVNVVDLESPDEKKMISQMTYNNPNIFSKKNPIKKLKFVLNLQKTKKLQNGTINYLMINGEKYKFVGNTLKVTKIK
jgi:hypothetical protein